MSNDAHSNLAVNVLVSHPSLITPACHLPDSTHRLLYNPAINHSWGYWDPSSSNDAVTWVPGVTGPHHHSAWIRLLIGSPEIVIKTHALNSNFVSIPYHVLSCTHYVPPVLNTIPIHICSAIKLPNGHRCTNVFINDRGFSDPSYEFDTLLLNGDGGCIPCH